MNNIERSYLMDMAEQGYSPTAIGPFHRIMVPYVLQSLQIAHDELVVDVGAAQGHVAISAREAGYRNVIALDIDPYNFQVFQQSYGIRSQLCNVDTDALPFGDGEIAAMVCFHLIEHLRSVDHFLPEVHRALRIGGVLVLVTPDWRKQYKTFWRDPTHKHPYDKESIARLLRMHQFVRTRTSSWGPRYGAGRVKGYRWFPTLGMIGADLMAVAFK